MTTIALHKYHEQIEGLLEEGQTELAAEHCRQILQQQPQHVATYRLLAKALLELGDYRGARELFQRVLSADPNDYIAHAGLAIIFKEEGVASQAIWHLERAYEIEPYNMAIQQELRALYLDYVKSQRNGRSADERLPLLANLPLTDGAVARLYLRGEMYEQAVDLLRESLAQEEDRIDLHVLLLEALWRDGRRMEAVNACLQVLDMLPNCIAANAVLAEIWLRTGRVEEARSYLQRVQALVLPDVTQLDGDSVTGWAFRAEGALPLPDEVFVEYLGDGLAFADEDSAAPTPAATRSAEAVEPGAAANASEDDDLFGWLEGLTDESLPVEASEEKTAVSGLLSSDWLADLPANPEEEPGEATLIAEGGFDDDLADLHSLDWLEDESGAGPISGRSQVETDFEPDWLADLAGDELEPLQMDSETAASWLSETDEGDEDEEETEDDGFDWLTPLAGEVGTGPGHGAGELDESQFADFAAEHEAEDDEEFEWRLTDELVSEKTAVATENLALASMGDSAGGSDDEPAETAADIPDWLMSSMQPEDIDEEQDSLTSVMADEFADWVAVQNADLLTEATEDSAWLELAEETAVTTPDDEPDWPTELKDDSAPLETGDLPDWLRGSALDLPDSTPLAEPAAEEAPAEMVEPLLVWPSAKDADGAGGEEITELTETFVEAGVDLEEVVSDDKEEMGIEPQDEAEDWLAESADSAADSLDWLDDLTTMALSDAEGDDLFGAADALPDWLQGEEQPAPVPRLDATDEAEDEETAVVEENLDWLDALAATSPAAESLDEQPTWQWPEEQLESEPDELAEAEIAASLAFAAMAASGEAAEDEASEEDDLEVFSFATAEPMEPAGDDFPDDLDDAMSWLEKLAGEPDAPVEELPSVAVRLDEEEFPDLDLAAALSALPLSDEPLPDLVEISEDDLAVFEADLLAAELGEMPADDALTLLADLDDLTIEPLEDDLSLAVPDDPDEAMAWLEQLAARQGAPLDELPSVDKDTWAATAVALPDAAEEEEEEVDEFDLFTAQAETDLAELEPLNEAMDWLAALESDETPIADEWFDISEEELEEEELEEIATPVLLDDSLLSELDWLEEMSGSAAEAVPVTELDEVEVDEAELAAALDLLEAMAYQPPVEPPVMTESAELTADDLAPDETWADLWSEMPMEEPPVEALDDLFAESPSPEALAALDDFFAMEDAVAETDLAPDFAAADSGIDFDADLLDSIPDDPDAAMVWLEQLAARQGAPLDELPSIEQAPMEDAIDLEEVEIVMETAVAEADLPEDIEDVMAWLEQLAARQGASLDELPTVTDAEQEIVTPAWIAAAQMAGEAEAEAGDEDVALEIVDFAVASFVEEELEEAETAVAETQVEIEDAADGEDDWPIVSTDELSRELAESGDTLPDWLGVTEESETDRILGHTDWLGALPEPDLDGWLAAEEEVTASGSLSAFSGDTGPLPEIDTRPFGDDRPAELDEFAGEFLAPDLDFGRSAVELDEARLSVAQQSLAAGELESALANYATLVETGEGLSTIIADLEVAARQHQDRPLLRRTLGDAYMRNGQLQKALETYRQALDQL